MGDIDTARKQMQCLLMQAEDAAEAPFDVILNIPLTASADASTAVSEHGWTPIPFDGVVKDVRVSQASTVADDTANYATISLVKRDEDGANSATVASHATDASDGTDNLLAYVGKQLTIDESRAQVDEGGALSLKVTKTGTGVSTTAGYVTVRIRRRGSSS